jgi:hypothetical protein
VVSPICVLEAVRERLPNESSLHYLLAHAG